MRGFLQSGADFLDDHKYAREYLAPRRAVPVEPQQGDLDLRPQPGAVGRRARRARRRPSSRRPRWRGSTRTAVITASPSRRSSRRFGLTQTGGRWRINTVDNGLLLSSSDVDTAYRQLNLYFLAPTQPHGRAGPGAAARPARADVQAHDAVAARPDRAAQWRGRHSLPAGHPARGRLGPGAQRAGDGAPRRRRHFGATRDARVGMSAQIIWTLAPAARHRSASGSSPTATTW